MPNFFVVKILKQEETRFFLNIRNVVIKAKIFDNDFQIWDLILNINQ